MYKIIRGTKFILSDHKINDSYPEDVSPMFAWMENLNLKKDITIFDVGTNIGLFSMVYANIYKESSIYSFEPVPFIHNIAKENFHLNSSVCKNIKLENLGLSDKEESLQLSLPKSSQHKRYKENINIGLYSIYGRGEEKFNADFLTLDKYVEREGISSLDFIKIDVEGHEYRVLQGALSTIKRFKPIIIFELNELTLKLSGNLPIEYLNFAHNNNYKVFGLGYGWGDSLVEINHADQINKVSDLILVS